MYMSILHACIYVLNVNVWWPRGSEEDIRSSWTWITDGQELLCRFWELSIKFSYPISQLSSPVTFSNNPHNLIFAACICGTIYWSMVKINSLYICPYKFDNQVTYIRKLTLPPPSIQLFPTVFQLEEDVHVPFPMPS